MKHPKQWRYQLQEIKKDSFKSIQYSYIVIDANDDYGLPIKHSFINHLKSSHNTVISYLSIGEAESYRPYFKNLNKDLILEENKNWDGNYTVRFWKEQWQQIIEVYLDQIMKQGFDGVYLDIVDVFHRFKNKKEYAEKMANFINRISRYTKNKNKNFKIFLQNGIDIITYIDNPKRLMADIDGVALEAYIFTYTDHNKTALSLSKEKEHFEYIKKYQNENKTILSVEYNLSEKQRKQYFSLAMQYNFTPLVTDLELKGRFFYNP